MLRRCEVINGTRIEVRRAEDNKKRSTTPRLYPDIATVSADREESAFADFHPPLNVYRDKSARGRHARGLEAALWLRICHWLSVIHAKFTDFRCQFDGMVNMPDNDAAERKGRFKLFQSDHGQFLTPRGWSKEQKAPSLSISQSHQKI